YPGRTDGAGRRQRTPAAGSPGRRWVGRTSRAQTSGRRGGGTGSGPATSAAGRRKRGPANGSRNDARRTSRAQTSGRRGGGSGSGPATSGAGRRERAPANGRRRARGDRV